MIYLPQRNSDASAVLEAPRGVTRKELAAVPNKTTIPRVCQQCGADFLALTCNVRQGKGKYCSVGCRDLARRQRTRDTILDCALSKIDKLPDGCWRWTGYIDTKTGCGRMYGGNYQTVNVHTVMYTQIVGPVPEGLELDHLCRHRWCVNPDHLEAVTHAVNLARGHAPTSLLHQSGKCKNGHTISPENTCFRKGTNDVVYCKVCRREQRAASQAA